jgi:ABC-type branched-subunit amino acid transport system permease subunit
VNPIPTGEYAVALTQRTLWVLLLAALAAAVLVLASRMAGAWWARAVQPQRAWGALAGTLVGLWLGAGLTVLNPIPAGRYRLLVTTTHARIWGLVVAALIAGALAALARGHGRRGLTERRQSLAGAAAVGVAAAAVLAPAFYAVNPFPDDYLFALLRFSERRLWVVLVGWSLVALACLFVWALMRSPWGRVVKSIREDEDAARSLGKNVFSYKMQSLVIGGVMGAIGGALLALTIQTVQPDTFLPQLTFFAYTVLILGGAARILGPVVGSVVFWFIVAGVDGFLRRAAAVGALPEQYFHAGSIGAVRFAFVGVGLMLLMIYRPQGLLGDRREMQLDVQ